MNKRVTSFLCSWALLLVLIGRSASVPSSNLLGIAPQDDVYYKALFSTPSSTIKCKDGSKKFTKSQLNDDFCDCPDGTDEPGTSACPGGTFYCRNAGHSPLAIFSSRVNDGICDCCDGSDEYDGRVNCSNTCWEAGKVARDKLKKKIYTFKEGATLRKQEIEKAKVAIVKDEAELSKLKNEEKILKGLVQQLKERKEQIEKAEEEERIKKEKEEKEKKETEEKEKKKDSEAQSKAVEEAVSQEKPIQSTEDKNGEASPSDQVLGEFSKNSVNEVEHTDTDNSPNERLPENEGSTKKKEEAPVADESRHGTVTKEEDGSENAELSKEELGRLVASRWTGESTGQETREVDADRDNKNEISSEEPKDAHDEHYEGYDSEIEDDRPSYNEDEDEGNHSEEFEEENHEDSSSSFKSMSDDELDLSDITTSTNPSWLEKIQQTVKNILQAVKLFQTPVDLSEAAHVRKEYDDSNAKLTKIQSRISSLTEKLKHDFGPEKEFYSFYGKCFEIKQNKYVYKMCPFKQASQEEGYSRTGLGNWDKFEESYKVMMFSGGDKCWNGPDRSLKVKLRCGLKNEVTDVGEPSRCEYEALLATPALCKEETLKELEDKLERMNKEEPKGGHDEL